MANPPEARATTYDITCPHCNKAFTAELLSGGAERYQGFKCPHCRLFVAYERTDGANGEHTEET